MAIEENEENIKLFSKMYKKCVNLAKKNFDLTQKADRSVVACAIIGESGKMYTGLNVGWWHSSCAEHVALSNSWQGGERKLKYLIAVKVEKDTGEVQCIAPCGICRQMFMFLQPDIKVVILDKKNNFKVYTIPQILPDVDDF